MQLTEGNPSLLIYIPSYNRYKRLCEQIEAIFPYLYKYNIFLIVRNNASTDIRYSDLHTQFIHEKFQIITNHVNVGGNPNIFNGFLHSPPYDYLWILGDDDTLHENSIDIVMSLLPKSPDLIYFTKGDTNLHIEEYNISDIIKILNYGLGLISCIIYRTNIIQSEIYKGYDYITSGWPHLAILFSTCIKIETLKILQYPAEKILDLQRVEPPSTDLATPYSLYGSVHLADFIKQKTTKHEFIKWIIYENIWNIMRYRKKNLIRYNDLIGYIFAESLTLYLYFYYQKISFLVKKGIYDLLGHIDGGKEFLVKLDKIVRIRKKWKLFNRDTVD
jgi:hypothetical protein